MTSKKKTQQISVSTRTLHDLLKPVLPCVDSTGMLSVLNAVQIELRGAYLVAQATDRYRLAICRQPLAHDEDGAVAEAPKGVEFKALIDAPDIRHILKLFPVGRHADSAVTLTLDGDRIRVEAVDGFGLSFSDLRVSYVLNDGDFPDIEKVAHGALTSTGDPLPTVGVSPEYLSAFKAAADRHDVFEIITPKEPKKPVVIKVGDHFLGLIMPRTKLSSSAEQAAPEWVDFLRVDKSEAAA